MTKAVKGFLSGVFVIAVVMAPACRPKTKPVTTPPVSATTATTPSTTSETKVTPPEDFVKTDTAEPRVDVDLLPENLEEANRIAQSRGYLRDAFFEYNESTLSADAQDALTSSADWLRRNPSYNILVEGHCDERGTEQYNLALGDHRANTAKDFLITLGVDAGRIRIVSYGEERPFDDGHDDSAWARNRRAHLVLVGR
jgi:peptidoglycan-associated lipoprotein